jgi:hypothetical protein
MNAQQVLAMRQGRERLDRLEAAFPGMTPTGVMVEYDTFKQLVETSEYLWELECTPIIRVREFTGPDPLDSEGGLE